MRVLSTSLASELKANDSPAREIVLLLLAMFSDIARPSTNDNQIIRLTYKVLRYGGFGELRYGFENIRTLRDYDALLCLQYVQSLGAILYLYLNCFL